jgi:hypothetical protein
MSDLRLRAVLSLGLVACFGVIATQAYWSTGATIAGATFSSGSMDLKVNNLDSAVNFTSVSLTGMLPANSTAGVLTVSNAGTAPLKYTVSAAATNSDSKGLGAAMAVRVTGDVSTSGNTPTKTCAGAALTGTGSSLTGPLVTTSRRLAPGSSEYLCFQITLPPTAPSALQSATTTATLTFSATSDLR